MNNKSETKVDGTKCTNNSETTPLNIGKDENVDMPVILEYLQLTTRNVFQ